MTDDVDRRRAVAHHEAGHSVAALAVGGRVVGATDVTSGHTCGRSWYVTPNAKARAVAALAGPLAELQERGQLERRPFPWDAVGGELDLDVVMAEAEAAEDAGGFFEEAVSDALALLERPSVWAAVERLAAALYESRVLDGDRIEALVAAAERDPDTLVAEEAYDEALRALAARLVAIQAKLDQAGAKLREIKRRRRRRRWPWRRRDRRKG